VSVCTDRSLANVRPDVISNIHIYSPPMSGCLYAVNSPMKVKSNVSILSVLIGWFLYKRGSVLFQFQIGGNLDEYSSLMKAKTNV